MLADPFQKGAPRTELVSGSNYAYSMTNITLLTGFLFRQICIVVLFTSKDFSATVFMVGEEAMSYQTHSQSTEIKEAILI